MEKLLTFQEALRDSERFKKRNLLLGNGFSIACKRDIFQYKSLLEQADFSAVPEVAEVFKTINTTDFEVVIRSLENSAQIIPIYFGGHGIAEKIQNHSQAVKTLLVETVAGNHPPNPNAIEETQFYACRKFLSYFLNKLNDGRVYTLNYDLLLYWALMHDDHPFDENLVELNTNDGFGEDEDADDPDYVIWKAEENSNYQRIHYVHGALHLFDRGVDLRKFTWNRVGSPLIDQTRSAMDDDMYPLFVAEGTSDQKLTKIRHSAYLEHSFKSFSGVVNVKTQTLFIHGHSLAENDAHILKKIGRGKIPTVYISLYGLPDSPANKQIIAAAEDLADMRDPRNPLDIKYYDAESAKVWG